MSVLILLYIVLLSLVMAFLEVQIEGNAGWAKNLPTWKFKNPIRSIIGWTTIDGYHVWLWAFIILIFHFPFIVGHNFSLDSELIVVESLLIFFVVEDFLWFVINPAWGLKKFFTKEIPWHPTKIFFLPQNYWISFLIIGVFEAVRRLV